MLIEVEAVLPVNAETYVIERDGAAMRAFIAEVSGLPIGAHLGNHQPPTTLRS